MKVARTEWNRKGFPRWNSPGKRKEGRHKKSLKKTFERDLLKMELTWGTAEREIHGEKEIAALSLMDRRNKRRRSLGLTY